MTRDHFVNVDTGLNELISIFIQRSCEAFASGRQPFELVSERSVDRGALLVNLAQILLKRA